MFAGCWNTLSLPFSGKFKSSFVQSTSRHNSDNYAQRELKTAVRFSVLVENLLFSTTIEMASRPTHSETDTGIPLSGDNRDDSLPTVAKGRAIAHTVSRRLPTAVRVWAQLTSCGIYGRQSGICAGFPCKFLFHRLLQIHHHLLSRAGSIGQLVAHVPSVLSFSPSKESSSNGICIILPPCKSSLLWWTRNKPLLPISSVISRVQFSDIYNIETAV
jgi:hypothetical protein